jgi:hypoxanthine phosphoribosyltransferase
MAEKTLVTKEQIEKRIKKLAEEIAKIYQGKKLILVGILKGAFVITADLIRALHEAGFEDVSISFLILKSYSDNSTVSRNISLIADIDIDPKDRHILIVDDIFDTGRSFEFVDKLMRSKKAASVEGFSLLSKPDRHQVVYRPKYIGFEVANVWVEGYGMDFNEAGRGNPDVIVSNLQ